MTYEFVFPPVGNADSIIMHPDGSSTVVIDLHKIPLLLNWFENKKQTIISRILYIRHEHRYDFPSLEDLVTFLENRRIRGIVTEISPPYHVLRNVKAGSIMLPKLGDMRENIQSEIQTIAEAKYPGSVEIQRKYAKQYEMSINEVMADLFRVFNVKLLK
jgi:hypothetical protein